MTKRSAFVAIAPMLASVLLVGACQPTAPKTSPQAEAAADTSAAAAATATTAVQPRTYDTKEFYIIRPHLDGAPAATETSNTMVAKDAAMKTVNPAALKAMDAAPAMRDADGARAKP